jgi:hypothetical protein
MNYNSSLGLDSHKHRAAQTALPYDWCEYCMSNNPIDKTEIVMLYGASIVCYMLLSQDTVIRHLSTWVLGSYCVTLIGVGNYYNFIMQQ